MESFDGWVSGQELLQISSLLQMKVFMYRNVRFVCFLCKGWHELAFVFTLLLLFFSFSFASEMSIL